MNKEVIKFLSCIILCMVATNTYSQGNLFSLDDIERKHISKWKVNKIFTETDTVKSFSNQNITGVAITGNFILSSQESYIRIILHADQTGEEYLVSELYSPKDVTKEKQQLIEYALETNSLYNIVTGTITIEINDAECEIEEVLFSSKKYVKSNKLYKQEKKSHKAKQDSLIVRKIQSNLNRNNQKWVAGVNEFSRKTYYEKKNLLPKNDKGEIPNMQGFEYYVGGIFEIGGESSSTSVKSSTTYAADFDWRNRHGKNWITSIKSQQCNQCWVFTPVGTAEALVNVYYNRLINIDLSEQDVASCSGGNIGSCQGGYIGTSANYIVNTGVVNESCFPYVGQDEPNEPCSLVSAGGNKCNSPVERISFNSRKSLSRNVDSLKEALINYGPICGGISNWWHFMPIVGYGTIQAGDILVDGDVGSGTTITIPSGDPLIGETYWIFKNSWGTGWGNNGYGLVKVDISKIYGRYALMFPVSSLQYSTSDIQCLDLDGDGYYYWGIGPKPANCPTCPDEADSDDSDPAKGPFDENYYSTVIWENFSSVGPNHYISGNEYWYNEYIKNNHIVNSGGKLIINDKVYVSPDAYIYVHAGGELVIDGGEIHGGKIIVNGTLTINSDFTYYDHGDGYIKLNGDLNAALNKNITFEGESKTNPMLYVESRCDFDSDFNAITFKNGKIVMQNTSSQLYLPNGIDALTMDNVTVTTQNGTYLDCNGITAYNTPNMLLKNSTFEKMKFGFFSSVVPSSEFLTIQNCSFKYCKYGLYLYNGGVDISNSYFNNNQINGIYSRSMDANSHFNNVDMNSNGSYGLYYTGSSTADANMDYSSASNNQDGLHLEGAFEFDISCSSINYNSSDGIEAYNNLDLYLGASKLYSNYRAIRGYGTSSSYYSNWFSINNGYNDLRSDYQCISGYFKGFYGYPVSCNNNYWKPGGGAPVQNTDYVVYGYMGSTRLTDNSPEYYFQPCYTPGPGDLTPMSMSFETDSYQTVKTSLGTMDLKTATETIFGVNKDNTFKHTNEEQFELLTELLLNNFNAPSPAEQWYIDYAYKKLMGKMGDKKNNHLNKKDKVLKVLRKLRKESLKNHAKENKKQLSPEVFAYLVDEANFLHFTGKTDEAIALLNNNAPQLANDDACYFRELICQMEIEAFMAQPGFDGDVDELLAQCECNTDQKSGEIDEEAVKETELEKVSELSLHVTPNPVNGHSKVSYCVPDEYLLSELKIVDASGRIVFSETIEGHSSSVDINSHEWNEGVYLVGIYKNNRLVKSEKMVIVK